MTLTRAARVIGGSTTQLFANLADSLFEHFQPGDELVLSALDHEANLASWVRLAARRSLHIKWWKGGENGRAGTTPKSNPILSPETLKPLLTSRTKLVACTHSSNILGTIHDIKAIASALHEEVPGALICVDAVAYAPHAGIDVKELGVDFYAFSWYKVYGPHMAMLYASTEAQKALTSLGHYFKRGTDLETKLGLASSSYELVASVPRVVEYLSPGGEVWGAVNAHEEELQGLILRYLESRSDVTIYGQVDQSREKRMPVVSFSVSGWRSQDVVEALERSSSYGIRWGHFYSHRLVTQVLGLPDPDGVVRISLVHYNTGSSFFLTKTPLTRFQSMKCKAC